MALRLAFMGTPEFSVPVLQALHGAGHDLVAVYSQPPRPGGRRGLDLVPSPVQKAAQHLNLPVFTPASWQDEGVQQQFVSLKLDVAVVVAYGLLLPASVLNAPRLGCYNGHASLLPRWRGAAPIQRAIMAGDRESGMMIMKMDTGLDSGPIAMAKKVSLGTEITAGQLHDQLSLLGADLMVDAMAWLEAGTLSVRPQGEGATYAHKISKRETRIDWNRAALEIDRMIRALSPVPGAWCEMEIGSRRERIRVLAGIPVFSGDVSPEQRKLLVSCAGGEQFLLTKLQKAGGRPVSAVEFLRGHDVGIIL